MTKMKFLAVLMFLGSAAVFAQSNNIQNAWNYLRSKDLDKAKAAIDLAAVHEDTKNKPKMFLYRAQIYMAILETKDDKFKNLDPDAEEKCFVAVVNCFKVDKDKTFFDDIRILLMPAAVRLFNKCMEAENNRQFDKAMHYTSLLYDGLPFDSDDAVKHQNITKEKLDFQMYREAFAGGNMQVAKEYLQKLIDEKYKEPAIYLYMSDIYGKEGNPEKQLSYIEQGRSLYDDNSMLITAELNYYINARKTDILLEKVTKAIDAGADDEFLFFIQGSILQDQKQFDKAEASYKKALDKDPGYENANYNLGAMFLNMGIAFNNDANNLPPKETKKMKDLDDQAKAAFAKAVPYLEKAHELDVKDKTVSRSLMQLYTTLGETEKYGKLKEEMDALKKEQKK